jgi:hypothetical protein
MRARITALLVMALLSSGFAPAQPGRPSGLEPTDAAVCRLVAGKAPWGRLEDYLVLAAVFDIDGDGRPETLVINDEGTMHNERFAVRRADGSEAKIAHADLRGIDGDDAWTLGQRWLIHDGRAYVIRFADTTGYPRYVSRVDAQLREHPLCKFIPHTEILWLPATPTDQSVCKRVEAGTVRYLETTALKASRTVVGPEVPGGVVQVTGRIHLDFANDRRPATLFLYEISSGAGRGCQLDYFDLAPSSRKGRDHVDLMHMQNLNLRDSFPRETCNDEEPRWFSYAGRQFLESQSRDSKAPQNSRDEFHVVDVMENGHPRRMCQARYLHLPADIAGVWNGSTWLPPGEDLN